MDESTFEYYSQQLYEVYINLVSLYNKLYGKNVEPLKDCTNEECIEHINNLLIEEE